MCEAAQSPRLLIVRPQSSLSSTDSKLESRDPPRQKMWSPQVLLRGSSRISYKTNDRVQIPKPVDVALSLIPQVRILESYYQFARRLAHFASRNIHREVHPPLPADSIGVQLPMLSRLVPCVSGKWRIQVVDSRLHLTPDVSGVALESNYQFRPRLLCLPVFVLQALESNCQFGQARLGVTFNRPLTFFSPLKKPTHSAASASIDQPLAPYQSQNGPVRVWPKAPFKET